MTAPAWVAPVGAGLLVGGLLANFYDDTTSLTDAGDTGEKIRDRLKDQRKDYNEQYDNLDKQLNGMFDINKNKCP